MLPVGAQERSAQRRVEPQAEVERPHDLPRAGREARLLPVDHRRGHASQEEDVPVVEVTVHAAQGQRGQVVRQWTDPQVREALPGAVQRPAVRSVRVGESQDRRLDDPQALQRRRHACRGGQRRYLERHRVRQPRMERRQ